jgi:predicted component of type VI protein secretion system
MQYYYKDRDFSEVKVSNSDIVAVIENPEQLERIIREHNHLVDQLIDSIEREAKLREEFQALLNNTDMVKEVFLAAQKKLGW